MGRRDLRPEGTFLLVKRFLQVSQAFERVNYASFLRNPFWWVVKTTGVLDKFRRRKIAELSDQQLALTSELARRYSGVVYQLFTWKGKQTGFSEGWSYIWYQLQAESLTMSNYRLFSPSLWNIIRRSGAAVEQLKPKVMLRQFVDEISDGVSRTTLCLLAYGSKVDAPPLESNEEKSKLLKEAYSLLHEELLVREKAGDLQLLSDNALVASEIKNLESPEVKYHEWLFKRKD